MRHAKRIARSAWDGENLQRSDAVTFWAAVFVLSVLVNLAIGALR